MISINLNVWITSDEIAKLFQMPEAELNKILPDLAKKADPTGKDIEHTDTGTFYNVGLVFALTYHIPTPGAHKYKEWVITQISGAIPEILQASEETSSQGIPQIPFGEAMKRLLKSTKK